MFNFERKVKIINKLLLKMYDETYFEPLFQEVSTIAHHRYSLSIHIISTSILSRNFYYYGKKQATHQNILEGEMTSGRVRLKRY